MATGAIAPNMATPFMGGNQNNPTGAAGGATTGAGAAVLPGAIPAAVPGATTAPSPTTAPAVGAPGMITSPIPGNTTDELTDIYGAGVGGYLSNLMSNGGINSGLLNQVNASEMNAMSGQVNQGAADLNATLGAEGVSGNSSTNALANSRYQAQATASENSQIAQNYMNEYDTGQSTLQSILGGVMQNAGDQPNWMDYLGFGESLATTIAGL